MPLVRGHDAYTAVEIAENLSTDPWGTVPSATAPQEWKSCPILSETMTLEREFYPKSKEFGEAGGLPFVEYGRGTVKGQLVVQPRYNQEWFWNLIAQFFCSELVQNDVELTTGTVLNTCNRHQFQFASALTKGFGLRVWKGGATQAGTIETFYGCMISRMVWEQPDDDVPRVTFDIIGKSVSLVNLTGAPKAVGIYNDTTVKTPIFVKARDLSNGPPASGSTYTQGTHFSFFGVGTFDDPTILKQLNIRGFTLTADRKLTAESAFANDPDTIEQPGVVETRDVTIEIRSLVEQDYATTGTTAKPYAQYLEKKESAVRIIYASTSVIAGTGPLQQRDAILLDMPKIVWEEARASISEPGAPPSIFKGRAILGTFAAPVGTPQTGDFRIYCVARDADDGTAQRWSIVVP